MAKFKFICVTEKVCKKTEQAMEDLEVEAKTEHLAFSLAAVKIIRKTGWTSIRECEQYILGKFCAY